MFQGVEKFSTNTEESYFSLPYVQSRLHLSQKMYTILVYLKNYSIIISQNTQIYA